MNTSRRESASRAAPLQVGLRSLLQAGLRSQVQAGLRRGTALAVIAALAGAPAVAVAQGASKPKRARVQTDAQRAAELVQRAAERYRAGKYVEAAVLFREAYALSKLPTQLRNAAKAYADGGLVDDALEAWRAYAVHPKLSPAERSEAEAQVALIEERRRTAQALADADAAKRAAEEAERARKLAEAESGRKLAEAESARLVGEAERAAEDAERKAAAARSGHSDEARTGAASSGIGAELVVGASDGATDVASGSSTDGSTGRASMDVSSGSASTDGASTSGASTGPWVVAGAGVVLGIVSGVLFGHATSRLSKLDEQLAIQDGSGLVYGITRAEAADELDGINGERAISVGLGAAAVGAIAGGLVWLALDGDDRALHARGSECGACALTGAGLAPLADGAVVSWTGAW